MFYLVFLVILSVPLIEVALFIVIGGWIGLWPTLSLAVVTAFVGTYLIRKQGLGVIARVQNELAHNRLPVTDLFSGLCLLVAGALLLTPGFATDVLGGLLLVPFIRYVLLGVLARHVSVMPKSARPSDDGIIDADYEDMTDRDTEPPPTIEHR